jgi:crotonobetaine/carnitine-CoA ligase
MNHSDSTSRSVLEALIARAEERPRSPFLSWHGDGRVEAWTYEEALGCVRRTAGGLVAAGVMRGDRVCSVLSNSPHAVWTWLATAAMGGTYVPLNVNLRGVLLQDQILRSGASTLVVDSERGSELAPFGADMRVIAVGEGDRVARAHQLPATEPAAITLPDPGAVGAILFTSGSTGRSKAALLAHEHVVQAARVCVDAFEVGPADVLHGWLPLYHIGGQVNVIAEALLAGAQAALCRPFSRTRFLHELTETGATIIAGFPFVIDFLLQAPPSEVRKVSSVRAALIAGASREAYVQARERLGIEILNVYGMTEAESIIVQTLKERSPDGSMGQPSPNFEVALLDDNDQPVARGEVGEIGVRPRVPNVLFRGYEGDNAATVTAWRNLWFHTGDLARQDEAGYLYFEGREIDRIRRRGENISASELESVLLQHPDISAACAVPIPSPLGEDDIKVAIAPQPTGTIDLDHVIAWATEQLPRFMVPRYWETFDELPSLPIGKPDKARIRQLTQSTRDISQSGPTLSRN